MGKGLIVVIVIVLILLMFGGMYVSSKNQMVAKNRPSSPTSLKWTTT